MLPPFLGALLLVGLSIFVSCSEKFPLAQLTQSQIPITVGDTTYVEIVPPFEGFNEPKAILVGNDLLLYVADTKNNRVVMMNVAGQILASRPILQPISLAQDLRLDLLVGGMVVEANGDSVGAIFRIKLVNEQHDLATAELDTIWKEPAKPKRRFVGIAVMPDNKFLVARQGPDNSSFVDPDTRVLTFLATDAFLTPLVDLVTRAGSGITDINRPTSMTAFPNSKDFVILQSSEGIAYGALWMVYHLEPNFEGWLPKFDPAQADQRFIDFVRPNRFLAPSGVVIDPRRRDIFIADAVLDSVIKFDSRGRFKRESFGSFQTGGRLKRPSGVAYFDRTLYVLDSQENKIFRFRLSTDFQ